MATEYTGQFDAAAYRTFCEHLKDVAAGTRGWISLTAHAKATGIKRSNLKVMAEALGLSVDIHGSHGYTAYKQVAR